jgi:cytochrome c
VKRARCVSKVQACPARDRSFQQEGLFKMRCSITMLAATALALALSACGSPPKDKAADTTTPATTETVANAGGKPAAFGQCAACHAVEPGKHGVGPSLAGVYGTKSGELAGYAFSDAMKAAKLTWDDKTLDEYLTNPMKKVPGTKMTFAGMADPAKRKEMIEYMKTLK